MDMTRSMLKEKNLPNEYWGEAFNFAAYILNRFPTKIVMNRDAKESWSGTKKFFTYMRVFGCVEYAHVSN